MLRAPSTPVDEPLAAVRGLAVAVVAGATGWALIVAGVLVVVDRLR